MTDSTLNDEQLAKLLLTIVDDMFEGFQIIDHDGRYVYLNKAAAKQGKRNPEELIGKRMIDEFPGVEKTEMYQLLQQCMTTRTSANMLNKFDFPDGTQGWFKLQMSPIEQGVFILSIDVSELLEKEYLIQEKNREMEKTIRLMVDREVKMAEMKEQLKSLLEKNT